MSSIHGHEVINMMLNANKGFTKESLIAKIKQEFGEKTLFHACSADEMTAEELVLFLERKGKFTPKDEGFNINKDSVCNHSHE